jgi:DUF1365 family protein
VSDRPSPAAGLGAAAIYPVTISHVRQSPIRHAFAYRSYLWLVDVDALPRLPRGLRWLAAFSPQDHCGDPDATLRDNVLGFLAEHGLAVGNGRILMLSNARVAGWVFNPLSVYWCHDDSGALIAVIAEVHNTYGQRHRYLLSTDARGGAAVDKEFYVSPFNPADEGRYRMSLPEPGDQLALTIVLDREGQRPFVASVRGSRRSATIGQVLRISARHPLSTFAVSARIRRQGIALWIKGLRPFPRPSSRPATRSADEREMVNS